MQPVSQNLDIYQGDTFDFFFRVRDRVWDSGTNQYVGGSYTSLTGWTGKAQIRANASSTTVLAECSVVISDQAVTPGGVLVSLTPAQTAALPSTGGVWDVELTNTLGEVRTFIKGTVTVTLEVTRP